MKQRWISQAAAVLALPVLGVPAQATDYRATPEDYRVVVSRLRPGDTLNLAPGDYSDNLPLHNLVGTAKRPITIRGPSGAERARFLARDGANTVSLKDAAHLVIDSLLLDGQGRNADAVKAESTSRSVHHITLSHLRIINYHRDQAIVGISAHCPTWGWIIRNNVIDRAGTGMYLGRSDRTAAFVGGLIEGNVIRNTKGYNLQIKHQTVRPPVQGMPGDRQVTVIRNNVFVKSEGASTEESARPNLLVGHFPLRGPGSNDEYIIYGNVFYDNPAEALFQGEGNIAVYNNAFVNPRGPAVHIQRHNAQPRDVKFFHNTVLARGMGVSITGVQPGLEPIVFGNAIFSDQDSRGVPPADNVALSLGDASRHLRAPFLIPPGLDLSPQNGALLGERTIPVAVSRLPESGLDLDGLQRGRSLAGAFTHRKQRRPLRIDEPPRPASGTRQP